ncbi:hypothetical protein [Caulobacter sp. X]|uniref:hypothetical protein n=1 Tax=Caulobacter sp. X TaxID=2048901 RepID=UPI000C14AABB|nr:hypothetical protein [Caulobacter sp. X]PIB96476.1 hypothetical protein CSW60_18380 [Caulobacter sp. X]
MSQKTKKPKRRQRGHGQLPAGFAARQQPDGSIRPRWIPQPNQRAAGWKGVNLVDEIGAYLPLGAAIERAKAINAAVEAWRAGGLVPADMAAFAPPKSAAEVAAIAVRADMQIGYFVDAWLDSREYKARAATTRRDYKNKLGRLLDAVAGFALLPDDEDAEALARHKAAVETVRGFSIMALAPEQQDGQELFDPLYEAYWALHRHAGVNQASGVLAVASVWLNWIHKRKRREVENWAAKVERETPPGRIRAATLDEVQALVRAADANGYEDVADAMVLSLDLSWSQTDVLALTEDRLIDYRALTGEQGRKKTGRIGGTPLTFLGRARVEAIRERRKADKVQPFAAADRRIVQLKRERQTTRRGDQADSDLIRKRFAKVRAMAAQDCPSVASLTFADLRDTAVTWAREAGLSDDQLASRTLQSRKNIAELHDKHYGEIGPAVADAGLVLLEGYYRTKGIKL